MTPKCPRCKCSEAVKKCDMTVQMLTQSDYYCNGCGGFFDV